MNKELALAGCFCLGLFPTPPTKAASLQLVTKNWNIFGSAPLLPLGGGKSPVRMPESWAKRFASGKVNNIHVLDNYSHSRR